MNTFILTLKHDAGRINLKVAATDLEAAKKIVMEAEKCPSHAIIKTKDMGRTMYKVVKIYSKSSRRQVIERNLTIEQAKAMVNASPDNSRSMLVFMKQNQVNY